MRCRPQLDRGREARVWIARARTTHDQGIQDQEASEEQSAAVGFLVKNLIGSWIRQRMKATGREGGREGEARPPRGIRSRGDNFHVRLAAAVVLR